VIVDSDSPPRYWFPAKRYGWGWGPPITWQGWVVFALWLAAFVGGLCYLAYRHVLAYRHGLLHIVFTAVMVTVLVVICYLKGEPPRWRWGK
jgi:hypothetical protein